MSDVDDTKPHFDPTNVIPLPPAPAPIQDTSDDGLAQTFLSEHAHCLRYVQQWGRWMVWDGARWVVDLNMRTNLRVHQTLRRIAKSEVVALERHFYKPVDKDSITTKQAKKTQARRDAIKSTQHLKSLKSRNATLQMAMPDPRVSSIPDDWDGLGSRHLLNTPAGTLDTITGTMYPHRPQDHITMLTSVAPEEIPIPGWTRFLSQITASDSALQAYIKRVCGYFLTGNTQEQALFFGYGTGTNGKSVLLNTIAGILGNEYHKTTPIETFVASQFDRHPTELANLRGARLVTSSETEKGRRWAEARIKMLTGGERVAARFMRQDFFEFVPQFKLFIIGNHKPHLRSVDEAMRRRFHLIPFTVTIPKQDRDPNLIEKLRPEWPGIMNWMLQGCLEWQATGLQTPIAVRQATEAYLAQEDIITNWHSACCRRDSNAFTATKELYESWEAWCRQNDEHAGTMRSFSEQLEQRGELFGVHQRRTAAMRGFAGIELKASIA